MRETFFFKRSTITLLVLGFLLFAIMATLKLTGQKQEVRRRAAAATTLSLIPAQTVLHAGEEVTLNIEIDTGANQVTAADITVNYDPVYLEGVSFTAGAYLPVVLSQATVGGGQARVVLGSTPAEPKTGQGILATLRLRALVSVAQSTVAFDAATQVAALGETGNVLTATTATEVQITQQIVPTPTPSPSPVATPTPVPTPTSTSMSDPCSNQQPLIPAGVTATALSTNQVHVSWQVVENATHYGLVYGTTSNAYSFGAADVGNVNAFTVSGLAGNTTYYFAVFAVNDCGTRGYSNETSAKTLAIVGGAPVTYVAPSSTPAVRRISPVPTAKASPSPQFVALDPNATEDEVIPYLAENTTTAANKLPVVPKVSIPPQTAGKNEGLGALLTPLGGILLIIAAIFATFFFFKMRG